MAQDFVIGVVQKCPAAWPRSRGAVAIGHGRKAPLRGLPSADRVILATPKTTSEGAPVQAVAAPARWTGIMSCPRDVLPGRETRSRATRSDAVAPLPVPASPDGLNLVGTPRHCGMAFPRGKFSIPEAGVRRIADAMGAAE